MSAGFRRRKVHRRRRGRPFLSPWREGLDFVWEIYPAVVTGVVAAALACSLIRVLEEQLRPVLLVAARAQTRNAVTVVLEAAILSELERQGLCYSDLVAVERGQDGSISAITTDMAAMNRLRSALIETLLPKVMEIDEKAISIPVGSLMDSELLWGRGPAIKVKSFTIGSVTAEFESEFRSAGVNQTLHKIWLSIRVPMLILLPGNQLEMDVDARLCIAETVIVGNVPSYVQKAYG